jgi:hypothetical protein
MPDLAAVLDQVVADFQELLGGEGRRQTAEAPSPPSADVHRPATLADRRAELDRLLRTELERQGIVVSGRDVARVVGVAVGKGIEWAG